LAASAPSSFRSAVLAAAVAFVGGVRLPDLVRRAGQGLTRSVLARLDARRAKLDPGLTPEREAQSRAR
jgi:hypothetical protein